MDKSPGLSRSDRLKKTKKKKPWLWITFSFLLIGAVSSSYLFYQVWGAMDQSFDPLEREKSSKRNQVVTMDEPFTILLVGADGTDDNWRSDTLIFAAINPEKKSAKLLSIPRDTYTEMANSNGVKTKINAAPYYGIKAGLDPETNMVETVEEFLNVPVDYFIKANFKGFIEIVDALGGVDVEVPFNFNMRLFNKWYTFNKGPAHLDGHEALAYVRMRKSDPRGDAGRNDRQQEVLQNLMSQAVNLNSMTKLDEIMQAVGNHVGHNLQIKEMYQLQATYRSIPKNNIETLHDRGYDSNQENSRGIWYHYISDEERLRLSLILRKQLDLPLKALDDRDYQGEIPDEEESQTGHETRL